MDQESPVGTKAVDRAFRLRTAADNPRQMASFLQASVSSSIEWWWWSQPFLLGSLAAFYDLHT